MQPFWQRLPYFFNYPFNTDTVLHLIGFGAFSFIASMPFFGGFFGFTVDWMGIYVRTIPLLFHLGILLGIMRYGYMVLERVAHGRLRPPGEGQKDQEPDNVLPVLQFAIFLFYIITTGSIAFLIGPAGAVLALIAVFFVMPASIMCLGVTRQFTQAANPAFLFKLILVIGVPYLLLVVFLMLLYLSSITLQNLLVRFLPFWLAMPATTMAFSYFNIVMFSMMGYVIYQYHERLGHEVDEDDDFYIGQTEESELDNHPDLVHARELIKQGQYEAAKQFLVQQVSKPTCPIGTKDFLFELLLKTRDKERLPPMAAERITAQYQQHDKDTAYKDLTKVLLVLPELVIENAAVLKAMIQEAAKRSAHRIVVILSDPMFAKKTSIDASIAYLRAKSLCEGMGRDRDAASLCEALLEQLPIGKFRDEVAEYHQFLIGLLNKKP